ncbi:carbohydrate porin [Pseudomonas soli]|jgi:porin|uniref:Carbohydrate porin n=1 Tax=Pseudomonas soli TaxID=1306993 RepID=A0A1H9JN02_9PSED|nr:MULTISPECIES: carbohydrate porin [Pseudomonas]AIN58174.1 porin [Pseudomonas soli]AUY32381.1 carbohydrate porin [Pseudomonas sp. PONIH3]MCX5506777.1 carbohydrate porin [Pseudomonas sp. BJa3]MDW9404312.1 carbohydrate porin [Pseudomonas soli]MEE1879132.1 carbohydrate porin [Pseudomonas soli]
MSSVSRLTPTLLLALASTPAFAADNTLTGDWGGLRQQLAADGITFTGDYSGETAYNAHGGLHRSARYSQNLKLGAQFDLSKLYGLDNGGKVQLTINDRRGNSASEDLVGNRLPIQENYGGLYTRLTELSYERNLSPALNLKLGYMAMGNDLGGLDSGILCNFMNAGFCGHPLNMSGGSGWTNYPNAHLGARLKYDLAPDWQLRVAAFNVDPESNGNSSRAWHLGPKHSTGTVLPLELVYKLRGQLPGEYKVGYYYDSSNVQRIGSSEEVAGRGGHYLLVDQAVWNDPALPGRSLHAFGQYSASSKAASPFTKWYGAGVVLYQPFAGRPRDTVALGYGRAVPNPRSRDVLEAAAFNAGQPFPDIDSAEQLIELSYGYQATPWLNLRPDVQYIVEPGAFSGKDIDNALVVGLQVKATF